jgi:hypothetical protein
MKKRETKLKDQVMNIRAGCSTFKNKGNFSARTAVYKLGLCLSITSSNSNGNRKTRDSYPEVGNGVPEKFFPDSRKN